ncbi:hypothetical protein [Frankia gtarii]|uniref:hypothetical protein n=1 Tax=Frankia gtarii TaxID=2950102 RepID=UPI0021C1869F|nr:hypothetical protein [Frankia gtarii]
MTGREGRHRHRGHQIRIPDDQWNAASDQAHNERNIGMRELIHGWIVAYATGQLDAHPIPDDEEPTAGPEDTPAA